MFLQAGGQYQYSNFGDTATFSFDDLPAGVSYSSDSGHFLTSAPEPSTWALMMIGFSGIIFWRSVESKSTRTTPLGDLWGLLFHFDRFMGQRRQQADEHRHEGGGLPSMTRSSSPTPA
jgi:hypothetical protein